MAHNLGRVIINNVPHYFEHDGTYDKAFTAIRKTIEEVIENWRKSSNSKNCIESTECTYTLAFLETNDESFDGDKFNPFLVTTICLKCMCINGKTREEY